MKQQASLWGGSVLRAWIMEGGRPAGTAEAGSRWRAQAFDAAFWLQRRLPPPPPLDRPPLFILGLWRTGTTLAHTLLAALPGTTAPRSWQCFRPASLRLMQPPAADAVPRPRPMDDVPVSTDSPQEDEFALLLAGAPSLYRGFLDPRRLHAMAPLLDGADGDSWIALFTEFARNVVLAQPGRLLVKSPNHLFRLAAIRAHFPDSPILVTVRDPVAVYWSNLRMWHMMAGHHGLWPAPEGAIEAFVIQAMEKAALRLRDLESAARSGLPVAVCHFDALARDPVSALAPLLPRLGLPENAGALRAAATASVATPRTRADPLPAAARGAADQLAAATAALLAAAGSANSAR